MGPIKVIGRGVQKLADAIMMTIIGNDANYIYNVSWVRIPRALRAARSPFPPRRRGSADPHRLWHSPSGLGAACGRAEPPEHGHVFRETARTAPGRILRLCPGSLRACCL